MIKVFLNYAIEDQYMAERLYNDLKDAGVFLWHPDKDLLPGQNWKLEIKKAIKESTIFLALLSTKSILKRGFTQKELKTALDNLDEMPESDIFIIPVRIDDCKPIDSKLQYLQWVDLFPSYEEGLNKILRAIQAMEKY
ncbi:toll/interleukin-1 receptor domain-containing protein [Desulfococcaceae bacterium HSG9]|nr:toll/interleukin-1 receptor domain-containing protein [Desulfococcaceae bacterium HSG9]